MTEQGLKAIKLSDIEAAYQRINAYIYKTPLEKSHYLSREDRAIFLKLECQQVGKSFKIRGAANKLNLLTKAEIEKGVATISSGNHGIAVAYAAAKLGISKVRIIVPETTPESKLEKIRFYGGEVVLLGNNYDEAHMMGMAYIDKYGMVYIDGGDFDADIYAGQGTAALEIMEQNPLIDAIYVPIGGGAFAIASAVAAKSVNPNVKVYGLYSEACPAWLESIEQGKCLVTYDSAPSICEAMVGGIGALAFEMRHWLDGAFEVKESIIREALCHAVLNEKIVVEASGAVPIAAVMQYGDKLPGKQIALILSGGNVDSSLLQCTLADHLSINQSTSHQ
ncbi:threonine/serine dehydratase [Fusibacter paucivorans]|uniref:Threonine/serine dehydratase n=1 Tax=Fusibacter paucivorans TaxID=76009 RepID=A0ABS5PS12_9FIRM|nr:threonine/serine dehydratase [Fusibacter paucivorans]MBS7527861.1 threonine/serine dehydratase [Fusibacter paucivorans]